MAIDQHWNACLICGVIGTIQSCTPDDGHTPRFESQHGRRVIRYGKYDLQPQAREALAKLSGIVLAHPGLRLSIEGYTDSTGTEAFNQTLSEQRANAVRDYLIQQSLEATSVTATGFGETSPAASNDTTAGRQLNRRVEIIISGEVIGTKIGGASAM